MRPERKSDSSQRKMRERPRARAYDAIVATDVESTTAPRVTARLLPKYVAKWPAVQASR